MTIHKKIKEARLRKRWSQKKLADAVSDAEGLKDEERLSWQTVQQWEKNTAPKRTRLEIVATALDVPLGELLGLAESDLSADEQQLLSHYRSLDPRVRAFVLNSVMSERRGDQPHGTDVPARRRDDPKKDTGTS